MRKYQTGLETIFAALLTSAVLTACGGVEGPEGEEAPAEVEASDDALKLPPVGFPNLTVRTATYDLEGRRILDCLDDIRVHIWVTNSGTRSAPASKLFVDGYTQQFGYIDVPALAPGATFPVPFLHVRVPAGVSLWEREVRVDATNVVAELVEIDNTTLASCGL